MRSLAAIVFAALAAACSTPAQPTAPPGSETPRTAWIVNTAGAPIGQAQFRAAPGGVLIRLEFSNGALPEGWHGTHLHMVGNCADAAAGFAVSGAHIGHGAAAVHGLANPMGPEAGDLPNIYAPAAGGFGAELFTDRVVLNPAEDEKRPALLDGDGAALIIHASADDHVSQPIGGAGARLACAALTSTP